MEEIEFLPLVKAYPALSKTYGEVSCVAGVQISGPGSPSWIRLYPVPFRALDNDQQFRKYQPIRVRVETHRGDQRPETRRPDRDSIQVISDAIPSDHAWVKRRRFVEPLMVPSMCDVQRRRRRDGTSLAVFRPKRVLDVVFRPADVKAGKREIAEAWARQGSLLDAVRDGAEERRQQLRELEQIPWKIMYQYECDDRACNGHTQSIIDWEVAGTYRRVRNQPDWQERVRDRWLRQLCANDRDTAFFVGNQHQHPTSFMVLGVWWPERRAEQLTLAGL